jgi:NAD-dependent SIR2 family protein deacetylase
MHKININQLAQQMHARKEQGEKPYVLFLGAGVSISSGVSDMDRLIKNFLIDSSVVSEDKIDEIDTEKRFEKFVAAMENLDEIDRYTWLKKGFENRIPSPGYGALTRLIEEGYFDLILTTNWDEFLDSGLENSKRLKDGQDFRIYVRGTGDNDFIIRSLKVFSAPRIKVLKLHGELESRVIFVTPKETKKFPKDLEDFLIDLFRTRNLMMIGYSVSDLDVKRCITARAKPNTLIYVDPYPSRDKSFIAITSKFRHTQQIAGTDAEFENFMRKLSDAVFKLSGGPGKAASARREEVPRDLLETINMNLQKLTKNSNWLVNHLKKKHHN